MSMAAQLIKSFEGRHTTSSDTSYVRRQVLIADYMRNAGAINEILHDCYEFPYIAIFLQPEAQTKIGEIIGETFNPGCKGAVTELLEAIGFTCEASGGDGTLKIEPIEASSVDF